RRTVIDRGPPSGPSRGASTCTSIPKPSTSPPYAVRPVEVIAVPQGVLGTLDPAPQVGWRDIRRVQIVATDRRNVLIDAQHPYPAQ
ncbi:MAG TPA: hypothetical protein PK428_07280, partial [Phycicoccus sp.]|nr:hypothetical protein [Phycicoccus sp.]